MSQILPASKPCLALCMDKTYSLIQGQGLARSKTLSIHEPHEPQDLQLRELSQDAFLKCPTFSIRQLLCKVLQGNSLIE